MSAFYKPRRGRRPRTPRRYRLRMSAEAGRGGDREDRWALTGASGWVGIGDSTVRFGAR